MIRLNHLALVAEQFLQAITISDVGHEAARGQLVQNVHGAKITRSDGASAGSGSSSRFRDGGPAGGTNRPSPGVAESCVSD